MSIGNFVKEHPVVTVLGIWSLESVIKYVSQDIRGSIEASGYYKAYGEWARLCSAEGRVIDPPKRLSAQKEEKKTEETETEKEEQNG